MIGGQTARGAVYLVGAGPGDPGLLTLRGGELLVTCDAVVYDALANPALLSLARAAEKEKPVELYDVGKRGGAGAVVRQADITALLLRLAGEGKRVVRLKGGDPFVFGRGGEEAQALAAAGVPFEIVPGVTAGIAAPAYAGIPVTHRGLATSVTFVTGHEDSLKEKATVDWSAVARTGGTVVLYMGMKTLSTVVAALVEGGMPPGTPAAVVERGTSPRQRTIVATLSTLVEATGRQGIAAPAITIVGPVVSLRAEIGWFDRRPLFGKRIVVTRARAQAGPLSARLSAAGAEVLELPATRIEPLDPAPLARALRRLDAYAWAIFTSQNAVRLFWNQLRAASLDTRALAGVKIAAVGPATAGALRENGIEVDLSPERFVAEALLHALGERHDLQGRRILYATAVGSRDMLPKGLAELGASVDVIPIYRSVADGDGAAALRGRLEHGQVDLITFTSASAVGAFVAAVGADAARRAPAASIGPLTTVAARQAGLEVVIEAGESTITGLVAAIAQQLGGGPD